MRRTMIPMLLASFAFADAGITPMPYHIEMAQLCPTTEIFVGALAMVLLLFGIAIYAIASALPAKRMGHLAGKAKALAAALLGVSLLLAGIHLLAPTILSGEPQPLTALWVVGIASIWLLSSSYLFSKAAGSFGLSPGYWIVASVVLIFTILLLALIAAWMRLNPLPEGC